MNNVNKFNILEHVVYIYVYVCVRMYIIYNIIYITFFNGIYILMLKIFSSLNICVKISLLRSRKL